MNLKRLQAWARKTLQRFARSAVRVTGGTVLSTMAILTLSADTLTGSRAVWIVNGETRPLLVRSTYDALSYGVPETMKEYNRTPVVKTETDGCGERFALLVHEPHGAPSRELALFDLLKNVTRDNRDEISSMTIFVEGAYAPPKFNESLGHPKDVRMPANTRQMVLDSANQWFNARRYEPLQRASVGMGLQQIDHSLRAYAGGEILSVAPANSTVSQTHRTAFLNHARFNKTTDMNGAIDSGKAFLSRISEFRNPNALAAANKWRDSVHQGNAHFAKWAIADFGLQAPFAFEIYAEGLSESSQPIVDVDVFGMEDLGIYAASCHLNGCLSVDPLGVVNEKTSKAWRDIQPYRDWVMSENIKNIADGKKTLPVVLASVKTHLPLVRQSLCRAGYDTATLYNRDSVLESLQIKISNAVASKEPHPNYWTTPLSILFFDETLARIFKRPIDDW